MLATRMPGIAHKIDTQPTPRQGIRPWLQLHRLGAWENAPAKLFLGRKKLPPHPCGILDPSIQGAVQ